MQIRNDNKNNKNKNIFYLDTPSQKYIAAPGMFRALPIQSVSPSALQANNVGVQTLHDSNPPM